MPLGTAALGSWRDREKHHPLFWLAALAGSGVVVIYSYFCGDRQFSLPDIALFAAMAMASVGYAEGARLGRELGSWQVICWALVFSTPLLIYPVYHAALVHGLHAGFQSWAGFIYAGLGSMFLGYFIWYRGLALGGIARVSQIQLFQPFLAIAFSVVLLREAISPAMLAAALLVCGCVILTKRFATIPPPTAAADFLVE